MSVCSQASTSPSCRVIFSDINKYDKHLSWSCSQWKPVWFNIKRHISANRRKRESFISDKWGGEEFWKFPLGCNNNWSQIFLLYMWGENTGGLTYLIGNVKTTLLGQEESGNALGKHDIHSAHSITDRLKACREAGGTHPSALSHIPLSDICLPLPHRKSRGKWK